MPIAKPLRMTDPVEVHSSSLARLSYDRQQAILQVEFREGTAYQYAGVPLMTYLFDRVLSVRVRRAGFLWEIGQPRIRRTEVRPIFRRRAISDLLMPAR
jgi:KTSC domain